MWHAMLVVMGVMTGIVKTMATVLIIEPSIIHHHHHQAICLKPNALVQLGRQSRGANTPGTTEGGQQKRPRNVAGASRRLLNA